MTQTTWALDRGALNDVLTRAMSGQGTTDGVAPFPVRVGEVRTIGLEVNHGAEPLEALAGIAHQIDGHMSTTADSTLAMISTEDGGFFVDVLDPRFWLLHTTSPAGWSQSVLRSVVARNRNVDWCWLTLDRVEGLRHRGQERWFKADFRGPTCCRRKASKVAGLKSSSRAMTPSTSKPSSDRTTARRPR